jgi:hypothetical protein
MTGYGYEYGYGTGVGEKQIDRVPFSTIAACKGNSVSLPGRR